MSFYWKAENIYQQDSPTLYWFCEEVLDSSIKLKLKETNKYFTSCLNDQTQIELDGLGASSKMSSSRILKVAELAKSASSNLVKCSYIVRLAEWSGSKTILELGTNLGIATMAFAENGLDVTTVEGSQGIYEYSIKGLNRWSNVQTIRSTFEGFLDENSKKFDMVFIDGDHTYESTMNLTESAKNILNEGGIIVLDDIRWSSGMKKAWSDILRDPAFNICIDLCMIGVIGHNPKVKTKIIRSLIPRKYKPWPIYLFRT